jgi:hypothetical protein
LSDPDLFQHIQLVARYTTGVDPEPHPPLAFFLDRLFQVSHVIHPGRTFRRQSGELDDKLFGGCAIRVESRENVLEKQTEEKRENEREPFDQKIVLLKKKFIRLFFKIRRFLLCHAVDQAKLLQFFRVAAGDFLKEA